MRMFHEDPTDLDMQPESVDRYYCNLCGNPVGWHLDGDDETPHPFYPYGISADGRRRWCEDCVMYLEERGHRFAAPSHE